MLSPFTGESGQATAVDLDVSQPCVVVWAQQATPHADSLRTEYSLFQTLASFPTCPQPLGWFEDSHLGYDILVLSKVAGTPLPRVMAHDGPVRPVMGAVSRQWALSLLEWLRVLQAQGMNAPALTLTHLVVTPDNHLAFQRLKPLPSAVATEATLVSMVGDLLYYWATTYRYNVHQPWACRPIRTTNRTFSLAFATLIEGLVQHQSTAFTLDTLYDALLHVDMHIKSAPLAPSAELPPAPTEQWRDLALQAGHQLAADMTRPTTDLTLYRGLAGWVLVLAEMLTTFGVEAWRQPLADATARLRQPLPAQPNPGSLYLGEAGIALALIKAGDALGNSDFVAHGLTLARTVATMPHDAPDLLWGTAGRLKFHLWLWQRTNDPLDFAAAEAAAAWLLESATPDAQEAGLFWQGAQAKEPSPYLGYGHGIAGIGDALLEFYTVTHDPKVLRTIQTIADTLRRLAVPTFNGAGVNWNNYLRDGVLLDQWCHGATGIAFFWAHLIQAGLTPPDDEMAQRTLHTVVQGSAYLSPCVCHGLAGSIEALLDGAAATRTPHYRQDAHNFWNCLDDFRTTRSNGVAWLNHHLQADDPALMIGYGGVLLALLRLLFPERPALLSAEGIWAGMPVADAPALG